MKNFWEKLKESSQPIMALAPMFDITDTAFRQIIAKCGKPDVFFTEFVSVDGLTNKKSRQEIIKYYLKYSKKEHPLVVQIWGTDPKKFCAAAKIISSLGFDGIDINMGCPDQKVVKIGAGAGLINTPLLAQEIIRETKRGADKIPVSVKTRIGYEKNAIKKWLPYLLKEKPASITIHGRTKKEMSKVPAHWDIIAEASEIVKRMGSKALILGNGDVKNLDDAYEKSRIFSVDGIMVGRAVLSNPWFFNKNKKCRTVKERLGLLKEHAKLFDGHFGDFKNFSGVKKYIKGYVSGFKGSREMRVDLMRSKNAKELVDKLNRLINSCVII